MKKNRATDVLAFDLADNVLAQRPSRKIKKLSGEIVISTDTVSRHAKVFAITPQRELTLCVIHGILHLLGYDDHRAIDVARMRRKENELLDFLSR